MTMDGFNKSVAKDKRNAKNIKSAKNTGAN